MLQYLFSHKTLAWDIFCTYYFKFKESPAKYTKKL